MKKTQPQQKQAAPAPEVLIFPDSPDVLNLDEASALLKISPKTLRRLVQNGEVKSFRIGRRYKIPKHALISYVLANMECLPAENTQGSHAAASGSY